MYGGSNLINKCRLITEYSTYKEQCAFTEAGPILAFAPCGPILLFVRGNCHTRGNIWKFVWRVCNPAAPAAPAGHPWPEPCYRRATVLSVHGDCAIVHCRQCYNHATPHSKVLQELKKIFIQSFLAVIQPRPRGGCIPASTCAPAPLPAPLGCCSARAALQALMARWHSSLWWSTVCLLRVLRVRKSRLHTGHFWCSMPHLYVHAMTTQRTHSHVQHTQTRYST